MPTDTAAKPDKKPRPRVKRDRGVAQVATVARRADMPVNDILVKLRAAHVKAIDGGPLYANSKIDIDEAMKAMAALARETARETPIAPPAPASPAPDPADSAPYLGDEDQPMPSHIQAGAAADALRDFPYIPNPDPDKSYRPIHISPNRQAYMVNRGYRFVVDKAHIRRIGLGTLDRFVNARGRVQYKDRELAYRTMDLVLAQRDNIRKQFLADRRAVGEAFEANIDDARRKLGRGADAKISAFEMPEGEAMDRKEAAESARYGITRVVLDPEKIAKTSGK